MPDYLYAPPTPEVQVYETTYFQPTGITLLPGYLSLGYIGATHHVDCQDLPPRVEKFV